MYHRISSGSIEEINRVLRLIQDNIPNPALAERGKSNTIADISGSVETSKKGIFVVTEPTPIGLTNILPINLSVSVSTTYPSFGWGANWGNNWGL
jgi:hypothetical protein